MYYASKIDWYNNGGVKKGEEVGSKDGVSDTGEGSSFTA